MSLYTSEDVAWIAGILEGEGAFLIGNSIYIQLSMTDRDVVAKAHSLMGAPTTLRPERNSHGHKPIYRFNVCGNNAAFWMVAIYKHMGGRRRDRIMECLRFWRDQPGHRRTHCMRGHELTDGNLYWRSNGKGRIRICKSCHIARQKAYLARKAA